MADIEDDSSLFSNQFDFDGKGQLLRGPDGFALGEAVDFHDLDGKPTQDGNAAPRIIGKTNPKVEHFTDDHPSSRRRLSVMEKVQKQLAVVTEIMDLDEPGRKHWYYRLKREYEKEAKLIKR